MNKLKYIFLILLLLPLNAEAMKQLIVAGNSDPLSNTATEYNALMGGSTWNTGSGSRRQIAASSGTFSNFTVELSAAPGGGGSYTFELRNVTQATGLSVTITDTDTSGTNAGSLSVTAGDSIHIISSDSGATAVPAARWSTIFEGGTANESLLMSTLGTSNTENRYIPVIHASATSVATASSTVQVIPTSGTIKNLYTALTSDPGTAPDAYQFVLWKNGVATSLTCTVVADNTSCNDTSNSVSVVAGDQVFIQSVPTNTPSGLPNVFIGMTFLSDIDGESLFLGSSSDNPSASGTEYNSIVTSTFSQLWDATESNVYQGGNNTETVTLRKFYAATQTGLAPTNPFTLTVKQASGDTTITCSISSTSCSDTTHTTTVANLDELSLKNVTGVGTQRAVGWGLVGYISPPAVGGGATPPFIIWFDDG